VRREQAMAGGGLLLTEERYHGAGIRRVERKI